MGFEALVGRPHPIFAVSKLSSFRCDTNTLAPGHYRYTQFCEHYRRWCKKRRLSMRQVHRAERCSVSIFLTGEGTQKGSPEGDGLPF